MEAVGKYHLFPTNYNCQKRLPPSLWRSEDRDVDKLQANKSSHLHSPNKFSQTPKTKNPHRSSHKSMNLRERIARVDEGRRLVEEFSAGYYGICTAGGMLSSATTHLAITPLDVLKVNMQVNPVKYNGMASGLSTLWREGGPASLWRGWSGKFFGYGIQGGCKFGLYEYFKRLYSNTLQDQNRSLVFFLSAASAQVFADVALCPFEAIKVRVQTQPSFAKGLLDGFPKLYRTEGLAGFYKGLVPLWGRNLPFSMVMFSTFEHSVDMIYSDIIQKRKDECSRIQQLGVTCLAGYAAGAVGTIVSNPADNIVSSLYNKKASSALEAVKKIGLGNLFTRSLPVRITLVGPVITLQWFLYDTIKVLSGLPTSGGLPLRLEEAS